MAIVGRAARGAGLPRRHHRAAGLALDARLHDARPPEPVLRRHRRQHGFDGEPLHRRTAASAATTPTRRDGVARQAARPLRDRLLAARARGVQGRADRRSAASRRRCAASRTSTTGRRRCAARVLLDAKADLLVYGNAERQICEIAHRLAAGTAHRRDPRPARHGVRAPGDARRLDRDRLDAASTTPGPLDAAASIRTRWSRRRNRRRRDCRAADRSTAGEAASGVDAVRALRAPRAERRPRAQRDPHAVVRAGRGRPGAVRARLAHPAPRGEPRQRARAGAAPRRRGRVAQPAADPAHDEGDGRGLRAAVPARAASRPTATRRSPPTR